MGIERRNARIFLTDEKHTNGRRSLDGVFTNVLVYVRVGKFDILVSVQKKEENTKMVNLTGTFRVGNKPILDLELEIIDAQRQGYEAYIEWVRKEPVLICHK